MSRTAIIQLPVAATAAPRKLLYLVLLAAFRDRASEVRFEPVTPGESYPLNYPPWTIPDENENEGDVWSVLRNEQWDGCRLRYKVDEVLYDLVPSPLRADEIWTEIVGLSYRLWLRLLQRLTKRMPHSCRFRLSVGGKVTLVTAVLEPAGHVVLRIPSVEASDEAWRLLDEFLRVHSVAG